ncbi:hypothetical protein M413DRAFT_14210 [Hebeloma cylindrosporum]|uniref:F-box domain-containing protein n=1 Tax=Hebeloma cylindrosporum TaxID=76867 RepID=A0A0C3BX11_HEBCY|nr:hypothetical protein M413DRAFT_14210 [Hebeloma cylindrosporum h7]
MDGNEGKEKNMQSDCMEDESRIDDLGLKIPHDQASYSSSYRKRASRFGCKRNTQIQDGGGRALRSLSDVHPVRTERRRQWNVELMNRAREARINLVLCGNSLPGLTVHSLPDMVTGNPYVELLHQICDALKRIIVPSSTHSPILELPNEVALSVCKKWRHLVPLANLLPARRRLLELYDSVINSKQFKRHARGALGPLRNRQKETFNWDTKLAHLTRSHPTLPDIFVLWMEEWPGRFELRQTTVCTSDLNRWFYLYLYFGTIHVGSARTKPNMKATSTHVHRSIWSRKQSVATPNNMISNRELFGPGNGFSGIAASLPSIGEAQIGGRIVRKETLG